MLVRDARHPEVGHLAQIWYDGWHEAHAQILPIELARLRTLESFYGRLAAALSSTRVAELCNLPVGFCMMRGAELYQLYVSDRARGCGAAAALVADAEARLQAADIRCTWLACAIGNERAGRFYEKCGWVRKGAVIESLEAGREAFALEVWRYEKHF